MLDSVSPWRTGLERVNWKIPCHFRTGERRCCLILRFKKYQRRYRVKVKLKASLFHLKGRSDHPMPLIFSEKHIGRKQRKYSKWRSRQAQGEDLQLAKGERQEDVEKSTRYDFTVLRVSWAERTQTYKSFTLQHCRHKLLWIVLRNNNKLSNKMGQDFLQICDRYIEFLWRFLFHLYPETEIIKGSFYSNRFSIFWALFLGKFVVTLYSSSENQKNLLPLRYQLIIILDFK